MFLGIDPDLHNTGIAIADKTGKIVHVDCCCVHRKLKGSNAVIEMAKVLDVQLAKYKMLHVAVEGQTINFKQTRNPGDILHLAHVAGIAVGIIASRGWVSLLIPTPREWKGQVPKQIHHQRILEDLGWKYKVHPGYCVPISPPVEMGIPLKATQWKHVIDAIGLARWLWRETVVRQRIDRAVHEKEKD